MNQQLVLADYLQRQYRFDVIPDPDGGYVIEYPDLPGCMTQVESVDEVSEAAREIFELWMEAAVESGFAVPDPTYPETHSGKILLRMPRSLHRRLAEMAEMEGVSLNQLTVALLAEKVGQRSASGESSPAPLPDERLVGAGDRR
jgi:predicted RNase H-like HicB family nuclease